MLYQGSQVQEIRHISSCIDLKMNECHPGREPTRVWHFEKSVEQPLCHRGLVCAWESFDSGGGFASETLAPHRMTEAHFTLTRSSFTGPSSPEGSNGEFALYGFTSAKVYFVVASAC